MTGVVSGERRVGVHGEEKQRARKEGKARRGRKEGERAALMRSNSTRATGEGSKALSCGAITQGHCRPNPLQSARTTSFALWASAARTTSFDVTEGVFKVKLFKNDWIALNYY